MPGLRQARGVATPLQSGNVVLSSRAAGEQAR